METTNNNNSMEHHNSTGGAGLVLGFILAMFNHIFGWLNQITPTSDHMNPFLQAALMGALGATISYFTNKFWKMIEKKYKKLKDAD
jgi:H+/Cl- antiporter ClcA